MEILSKSLEDTRRFAADFLATLEPRTGATVIGLSGDLGSGKTTFVQCAAAALGVRESITSPTFVILKTFKSRRFGRDPDPRHGASGLSNSRTFKHLVHIDAYRLKSGEELRKLGFEELLADPKNLILIEWPEHVKDILPPKHPIITFEFIDETNRRFTLPK